MDPSQLQPEKRSNTSCAVVFHCCAQISGKRVHVYPLMRGETDVSSIFGSVDIPSCYQTKTTYHGTEKMEMRNIDRVTIHSQRQDSSFEELLTLP